MTRRSRGRDVDGILLLDKPIGVSSNRALQMVKRLFDARKAGHTGNLDPLATGMLPLCMGHATKLSGLLLDSDKTYLADVRLGESTTTGDAEGEVVNRSDASGVARDEVLEALPRFQGRIEQVPPMFSALKQNGKRLYELAREGLSVEREARIVTIRSIELLSFETGRFVLSVHCSKGTYIRTLAEDIARSIGQEAHLGGLRRTAVAPFGGKPMITIEALEALAAEGQEALDAQLLPLAEAVPAWEKLSLPDESLRRLARGQALSIPVPNLAHEDSLALTDARGELVAAGTIDESGRLVSRRWLTSRDFA